MYNCFAKQLVKRKKRVKIYLKITFFESGSAKFGNYLEDRHFKALN